MYLRSQRHAIEPIRARPSRVFDTRYADNDDEASYNDNNVNSNESHTFPSHDFNDTTADPYDTSYDKALHLNQFQTDRMLATRLMTLLYDTLMTTLPHVPFDMFLFIEPSAGHGAFYDIMPEHQRVGIDIDPDTAEGHPEYIIANFLSLNGSDIVDHATRNDMFTPHYQNMRSSTPASFNGGTYDRRRVVVVGNPPYNDGQRFRGGLRNMALQFVNHASTMADTVAFVLGANFNRLDVQDKVADDMHLIVDLPIPEYWSQFEVADQRYGRRGQKAQVHTVFQIWQRQYDPTDPTRQRTLRRVRHSDAVPVIKDGIWTDPQTGERGDFEICLPSDDRANICMRRWGNVGEVIDDPGRVRELIREARAAERRRHVDRPDIYSADYKMARATGSFFHLYCNDPYHVAEQLRKRRHMFSDYAKRTTPGNSGSLNQRDLLRIYLQPIEPGLPHTTV